MGSTQLPVVAQTVSKDVSWLKQHETILIVFLVLLVGTFVVYKYFDLAATIETHKAQQEQAVEAIQQQKNDADLAQAKQSLAAYQALITQSLAANTTLSSAIANRDKTVVIQQATDAKMPPSQLATRWQGLIADSGVQPSTTGYVLTDSAGLATVEKLEQLPVLQQDIKDEQTKETNLQNDVNKANDLIDKGKTVVVGLQSQITDQSKADAATLAATKAAANRGKIKSFFIGFGIGFIAGATVHVW